MARNSTKQETDTTTPPAPNSEDTAAQNAGDTTAPAPAGSVEPSGMVGIVITVDHVYLALDRDGHGRPDWATTSEPTQAVAKRDRLQVPRDLAEFLSRRDQAEIL